MQIDRAATLAAIQVALDEIKSGQPTATISTPELRDYMSRYEMGFYLENHTRLQGGTTTDPLLTVLILNSDYDRVAEPEYEAALSQFNVQTAMEHLVKAMEEHAADFDSRYSKEQA